MSRSWWLPSLCVVVLAGCSDMSTQPRLSPEPAAPSYNEELDPPKDWPVRINSARADAWWYGASGGYVKVQGSMNYNAYHAGISANLTLVKGMQSIPQTFDWREKHTGWSYANNSHLTDFTLSYEGCDNRVQGEVYFRAWWRGISVGDGQSVLDEDRTSRDVSSNQESQEPCPPPPPSSGGGGGDGGGVTWCRYEDYFDASTGAYLGSREVFCIDL